jgi:hypothetical protein
MYYALRRRNGRFIPKHIARRTKIIKEVGKVLSYALIMALIAWCIHEMTPIAENAEAHEEPVVEEVVEEKRVPVILVPYIDWTRERIEKEIETHAQAYKVNAETMKKVVECESNFYKDAHNTSDPYGGAKGVAQFLEPTFRAYAPKAGIVNHDIWNPEHQLKTMAYMFSLGEARQWTCYRLLK